MELLLMSNGTAPGREYLAHALETLDALLQGVDRVAFVPYAQRSLDAHTEFVAAAMRPLGVEVVGVHRGVEPHRVVESAGAVFVGGGNAFRLLAALYRHGLVQAIQSAVTRGAVYVGSSAGTNVACPTIRTTNDMPIVEPPSLDALRLVPFQINPHYPAAEVLNGHLGETRDERIAEFLEDNDVPALGLQEGSWLHVTEATARIGGVAGARLFLRDAPAENLVPGSEISFLMSTQPRYDDPSPDL
ncbi:MAG: dipeptidase PepE [Nocardioides sp.]